MDRVLILLMEQVTVDAADDNQESENTDSQDGEEPEKPDGNGQSAEAEEISLSDIQRAISFLSL